MFRPWKRAAEASSGAEERRSMRIGITGAGAVGRSVAQELIDYGHKVLLIEHRVGHYEPHTVPDADWMLADACELAVLQEAGIQTCDVVIAATGDDKANLTTSLLAKTEFGVARVIARVNDMRNQWLFTEAWGVDLAVSAPAALVGAIEGAIDIGHVIRLMELRQGQVSLAKLTLPEGDPLVGRRMAELPMLENSALAVVIRESGIVVPTPDDVLEAGDEMLFVVGGGLANQVSALVQGAIEPLGDQAHPAG
ncbi:putative potassium uptake protein [Mycolicibacterium pulveris]|uniref:Putative potassium uptake protein n=2 Tax=Mycolicibacterium pulveris TaxID=36813 RepID=A0A7I7UJT4_MYCPV|nr:putative potassium uptake protein [Mycolicibacterium pulveris]